MLLDSELLQKLPKHIQPIVKGLYKSDIGYYIYLKAPYLFNSTQSSVEHVKTFKDLLGCCVKGNLTRPLTVKDFDIKYTYNNTPFGWGWPVTVGGHSLFYLFSKDLKALKLFVKSNLDVISDYISSDDNYGLSFYDCGYNGESQQAFVDSWSELGVVVF